MKKRANEGKLRREREKEEGKRGRSQLNVGFQKSQVITYQ